MTRKKTTKCQDCGAGIQSKGKTNKKIYCHSCLIERRKHQQYLSNIRRARIRQATTRATKSANGEYIREPFDKSFYAMALRDIAKVDGVSFQAVDQTCKRAMAKFKKEYRKQYGTPDFEGVDISEPYRLTTEYLDLENSMGETIASLEIIPTNNQF